MLRRLARRAKAKAIALTVPEGGVAGSGALRPTREELAARGMTFPEALVADQPFAQKYLADGTLVLGNQTYNAPIIFKFEGDTNRVVIGNWSSISTSAKFYVGGLHPTTWVSQYGIREMFDLPGAFASGAPWSKGDIVVGSDCWVTNDVTVLSGITIGDGAVAGTAAVVTRDIPPYHIAAGNPAKVIGQRFTDDQIAALLRIRWFDWPTEQVLANAEWLNGASIEAFIERFDPSA